MSPLAAFALGLPDFYLLLPIATVLAAAVSLILGFYAATYARAAGGAFFLALAWMAVAVIYNVALGKALGLAAVFVVIALVGHKVRRLRSGPTALRP